MAENLIITQRACKFGCFSVFLLISWLAFPFLSYSATEKTSPSSTQGRSGTLKDNLASAMKEKQEFERYIRKQLKNLEGKAEVLREKSTELHESTKSQLHENLEKLKEQKQELLAKMEELRNSGENRWQDIRQSILKTMKDLEHSLYEYSAPKSP